MKTSQNNMLIALGENELNSITGGSVPQIVISPGFPVPPCFPRPGLPVAY